MPDPIEALAVELNEESKAKRRGRPPKAAAEQHVLEPEREPQWAKVDFTGPKPHFPVYGESWQEEKGGPIKYWHGTGWYLQEAPAERPGVGGTGADAVKAMKNASAEQALESKTQEEEETLADEANREQEQETEPQSDTEEETTSPVVERIENFNEDLALNPRTLVEDVRDHMIDLYKARPKPWSAMAENEQRDVAAALEQFATDFVRKVIEAVRSDGEQQPIRCLLEGYSEKDGIKASLKVRSFDPEEELAAVIGLHKARGKMVLVSVASVEDYRGGRDAETQPDQPEIQFEAGSANDYDEGDLEQETELED